MEQQVKDTVDVFQVWASSIESVRIETDYAHRMKITILSIT